LGWHNMSLSLVTGLWATEKPCCDRILPILSLTPFT
jgi:hypothetical protein